MKASTHGCQVQQVSPKPRHAFDIIPIIRSTVDMAIKAQAAGWIQEDASRIRHARQAALDRFDHRHLHTARWSRPREIST